MDATKFSIGRASVPAPMLSSWRVVSPLCHALGYGDMSVGSGRALNRDDGFLQFAVEILRVQCAENFLKVTCSSACFDGFFHFRILTFVFSISASVSRRDKGLRVVPR